MKGSRRDPFEGLVLDEHFVRAARFSEPPALERVRRRGAVTVVPARRRWTRRLGWRSLPGHRVARMLTLLSLFAAFFGIAFGVYRQASRSMPTPAARAADVTVRVFSGRAAALASAADDVPGGARGGVPLTTEGSLNPGAVAAAGVGAQAAGSSGSGEDAGAGDDPPAPIWASVLRVRDCVRPAGDSAEATLVAVSCQTPHPEEVTGLVDLRRRFGAWPGTADVAAYARSACRKELAVYPGVGTAAYDAAAMVPGRAAWDGGVRVLVCTIRLPSGLPGGVGGTELASPATPVPAATASATHASAATASAGGAARPGGTST